MAGTLSKWTLFLVNALIPVSVLLFCSGYFPYKPILPGAAEQSDWEKAPPIFDKVILMVVDALRSDFVYSNNSGFVFTQNLIRTGAALPFTAHASSPTVTMPRIKAITTGSVPSFSDVVLNIAESESMSTLVHQDTIITQLKNGLPGKMLMYGDDTWLNLFPNTFDRFEGTSSFFVSDFTEVDNNVTRHVSPELARDDWSVMVLHYLGLDHIGHKAGPKSSHMIPKQREMDGIVENIYNAMLSESHLESTLLVLCGDHGMNEAGNHGGSSAGETSPALTFISPKLKTHAEKVQLKVLDSPIEAKEFEYYRTVEQSDITPTLAGLLGVPIPLNSLGVFIPEFLGLWENEMDRLTVLLENTAQIQKVIKMAYPKFFSNDKIFKDVSNGNGAHLSSSALERLENELIAAGMSESADESSQKAYYRFLHSAQSLMSGAASSYKLSMLYSGTLMAAFACLVSGVIAYCTLSTSQTSSTVFLFVTSMLHGSMMFASSFVEEEQQFWYWISTAWAVYIHLKSTSKFGARILSIRSIAYSLSFIAAGRFVRRWNQTGQKFAGEPDTVQYLTSSQPMLLWALVLLTYIVNCQELIRSAPFRDIFGKLLWTILSVAVSLAAIIFKVSFTAADAPELLYPLMLRITKWGFQFSLVFQARIVFIGITLLVGIFVFSSFRSVGIQNVQRKRLLHEALALFLITQSRATNIPLFLLFKVQASIVELVDLNSIETTLNLILMQHVAFFAFGGSNALSSVNLSTAYNGVSDYNVVVVGLLTFISNWAGPIWWMSETAINQRRMSPVEATNRVALLSFSTTIELLAVMAACTVLRTHLFVWTVFSPKFLYSIAWALANHLGMNLFATCSLSL
ncbi:transferase (Gpi7), putative [Talaromyces stipitatus ATCC 10500]|uniref:GPI ethanolamine phosphate transferase 2 n=1 Tax=Talaromyces stipitatus (strain ATCC 10500 / CBS 375.48 / QM 6759 / NRRL 1006) TaxID=441959 RepID=B8MTR0_TALSN|nr:transferase (Gpi7), putative [Talaromyces stipitatus ATCC 10500]EED12545.1 transferase (Gpi7), putative [Talaromyces stipitatus ATCC 10500]